MDLTPVRGAPRTKFNLPPGLFLMSGGAGSGKTLALRTMFRLVRDASDIPTSYVYAFEPGARPPITDGPASVPFTVFSKYTDDLKSVLAATRGGVLFFDSVTYVLGKLASTDIKQPVTFPKGVTERDIRGTLDHDSLARSYDVAMVATINSELYPGAEFLEGACEGYVRVSNPSRIVIRDRGTRADRPFEFTQAELNKAARDVGYPERGGLTPNSYTV